jgi:hypothetical protein
LLLDINAARTPDAVRPYIEPSGFLNTGVLLTVASDIFIATFAFILPCTAFSSRHNGDRQPDIFNHHSLRLSLSKKAYWTLDSGNFESGEPLSRLENTDFFV